MVEIKIQCNQEVININTTDSCIVITLNKPNAHGGSVSYNAGGGGIGMPTYHCCKNCANQYQSGGRG